MIKKTHKHMQEASSSHKAYIPSTASKNTKYDIMPATNKYTTLATAMSPRILLETRYLLWYIQL